MHDDRQALAIAPALCEMAAELLECGPVTTEDDLVSLGADSLVLTALAGRIDQRWSVRMSFGDLMRTPRVSDLAALIERGMAGCDTSGAALGPVALDALSDDEIEAQLKALEN